MSSSDLIIIQQQASSFLEYIRGKKTGITTNLGHFPLLWKFLQKESSLLTDPNYIQTVDVMLCHTDLGVASKKQQKESRLRQEHTRALLEKTDINRLKRLLVSQDPSKSRLRTRSLTDMMSSLHASQPPSPSPPIPSPSSSETTLEAHIFIDNSNIFYGAQTLLPTLTQASKWNVRIHYPRLFVLLEGKFQVAKRVIVASAPLTQHIHPHVDRHEYESYILERVKKNNGTTKGYTEQCVDELLNSKISDSLLDAPQPGVLILATGDGMDAEFGYGFSKNVSRALTRGWKVIVSIVEVKLSKCV
jgi:hypothetical protein